MSIEHIPEKYKYDALYKVIIIGDSGSGKTATLQRFSDGVFNDAYISTIGVDFRYKKVDINGKIVKLQIWDTAGQERFRTITAAYYRGAEAIIIVYDLTNIESYNHVSHWLAEYFKYKPAGSPRAGFMLLGNKCDLLPEPKDGNLYRNMAAAQFAAENDMLYYEISAKSDINISDAFNSFVAKLLTRECLPAPTGPPIYPPPIPNKTRCCF